MRDADECLKEQNRRRKKDVELDELVPLVAKKLGVTPGDIREGGKQPKRVAARSPLFWVVKEFGHSATEIAGWLGVSPSAVR